MAALRGDKDGALRRFRDVMERHPYGYFMVLSAARLRDADPAGAKEWLAALHARSRGEGSACSDASVVPQSAPFELVRGLLEAGDVESARAEITRAGWLSEEVPRETVWASLYLLERAGRPDLAHGAARTRLWAWLARYPESYFRQGWELAFPKAFEPLVLGESARNALPPSTVWSVMREESGFVPEAKSPANAYGLLQLVPGTAKLVGKGLDFFLHAPPDERSLLRPEVSIALGARLLAQLQQGFATHPALALAAYNAGSGAVGRWMAARGHMPADLFVETIPYEETRLYVKKVLASRVAYAALYSPTELDTLLALPNEAVGGAAAAAARLP
jgi:soluble lytic murein transglycosylase